MLALARSSIAEEGRRVATFAKRNPLTIAGAIIGLFIAAYVVHGLEGRIGHVAHDQQIVEHRVVRIGTCAASPHSQLCLQSITRGVKRCLSDPTCHNLIASATVVVHQATGPRSSSPIPGGQSAGARGSPAAVAPPPSSPQNVTPGPHDTSPPPSGHQGHQGGTEAPSGSEGTAPPPETPAEAPQEASAASPTPEPAPPASTADVTPQKPPPAVSVCLGKLPCLEVPQLVPIR